MKRSGGSIGGGGRSSEEHRHISRFVKQLHRAADVSRKSIVDRAEGRDVRGTGKEREREKTAMHHLIEWKPNRRRRRLGKIKVVVLR